MSDTASTLPKPKKSVALSGTPAGNTALCTVGRSGNDLHYRGYDIHDLATKSTFEEVAHLLVHGTLPTASQLAAYKTKLKRLRGLPAIVQEALELVPANAHPMDVMRTGCSVLGTVLPEREGHPASEARDIADRLMASFGSMLLYWWHFTRNGRRIDVETDDDSIAAHFLHLLHGEPPSALHADAMDKSLILYAEHEFNASTFAARVIAGTGSDMHSCITGAIGALRGPKHGGANEVAMDIISRYATADEAEADIRARVERKEIVIGFGHPVYTIGDPRNPIIKEISRKLCADGGNKTLFDVSERIENADDGHQEDVPEPRLVQRVELPHDGRADADVHAAVRDRAHLGLERARDRAARGRQDHPPERELHRSGRPRLRADRQALSSRDRASLLSHANAKERKKAAHCAAFSPGVGATADGRSGQAFVLQHFLHGRIGFHVADEAREVGEAGQVDALCLRPARDDVQVGIGDRTAAGQPVLAGELRVGAFEQAAQRLARRVLALADRGLVVEVGGRAEQRLERRMHVGIDEGQPAVHFGAALRRAVAAEPASGKLSAR